MTFAQKKTGKNTLICPFLFKKQKIRTKHVENELTLGMGHLYWKHIGHEPYDIKHGRFSPWGDRFAVLERVCNTRQPFMLAASLIAHRTSDTEKKNILSAFEKSPHKLSPLKCFAFTRNLS